MRCGSREVVTRLEAGSGTHPCAMWGERDYAAPPRVNYKLHNTNHGVDFDTMLYC